MEVRRAGILVASELLLLTALGVFLGTVGFGVGVLGAEPLPIAIVVVLLAGIGGSLGWLVAEEGADELREDPTPVAALLLTVALLTATILAAVLLVGQSLVGAVVGVAAAALLGGVVLRQGLDHAIERPAVVVAAFLATLLGLLGLGILTGNVGFSGGNVAIDVGTVLLVSAVLGLVIGIAYVLFRKRSTVEEGARRVAENPRPILGGAVVALLSAALFFVGMGIGGQSLFGLALGLVGVGLLVALVALTGPDFPVRRPLLMLGAFAGLILLVFVVGMATGRAAIHLGGVGIVAGPIIMVVVLLGVLVGVAWLGLKILTGDDEAPEEGSGETS